MNTNASPDPEVTVYSKPACVQCTMTKKALEKEGIAYREVDVTQNASALDYVMVELGYSQAPVVQVDDENHWSGFRPDLISRTAAALRRTA